MKKALLFSLTILMGTSCAFALDTVFDSMDKATEVKLAPAIKVNSTATTNSNSFTIPDTSANTTKSAVSTKTTEATKQAVNKGGSIKTEKFNNALVNLDDAQVELRQELSEVTAKYNVAVEEREKAVANCKNLKKEINAINKKMKNIEKSKKMINKNLESE